MYIWYVYVYITYTHTYIHTHTHKNKTIHTYIQSQPRRPPAPAAPLPSRMPRRAGSVYMYICMHVCMFRLMHVYGQFRNLCVHVFINTFTYACINSLKKYPLSARRRNLYIHTCMHTYTHTHTHTYIYKQFKEK